MAPPPVKRTKTASSPRYPLRSANVMEEFSAVIYVRYSSQSQRDVSIEQQIRHCKAFADRQGIQIVNIYEDRALTGTNDNRPGFQKMIHDAERSNWDYVIVYTLDRFARNRYDSAVYKRQLKNLGIKVLSAMENISDDPSGVLMESMLEGLAEYYSAELSQKIKRGNYDNAMKCKANGSLPLGYVRGEDGRFAIDEAEAAIVQEVFRRVADGEPFTDIVRDMNNRGIRTKKGSPWSKSTFNTMLSNERYTGIYIYGDVRIPGGVPPIISQNLFNEVQQRLHTKGNPRTGGMPQRRRREGGTYLLTGKLFCGHCKNPMVGISGKSQGAAPYYYYTCKGKRENHSCNKRNISREHIETTIATALKDTMLTDKAIRALADAAVQYQNQSSINLEIETIENRLAEIKKSLNNLLAAIEAGIITATTKDRMAELESEQRQLTAQLSLLQSEVEDRITREDVIAALEFFQNGNVDCKDYQEALIDTFLVAAYVYDDELKIVFNLGGKKKERRIPFDIDDVVFSDTCIKNPRLHQTFLYKQFGTLVIMVDELFVFHISI